MRPGRPEGGFPEARVTRPTMLGAAAVALAVAVVSVVALTRSPSSGQPRGASAHNARTKLGPILVNRRRHTLYLFLADRHGRSTCYGGCARVWPPAIVSSRPRVGPGVLAAKVTTTTRRDHRLQLVYNGHPLYAMSADTRPGEIEGEGFLGAWFVVSPAGHRIATPGASLSHRY
jgi:predicted lipoprotein with Yx(FWY)xxD motif